jgi:hypothetical protein
VQKAKLELRRQRAATELGILFFVKSLDTVSAISAGRKNDGYRSSEREAKAKETTYDGRTT